MGDSYMRKIKAILAFIRNQEWVEEPQWGDEDEKALTAFLTSPAGRKLSLILLNLTLRQNASAVLKEGQKLAEACGYAKGFRGCVATLESLATSKLNSAIPDHGDDADESVVN